MQKLIRSPATAILVTFLLTLSGCASTAHKPDLDTPGPYEARSDAPVVVGISEYHDPLEPLNRPIFKFNDVIYRYGLTPLSKGYLAIVPAPVQTGVGNFFDNLREPLNSLNHLLRADPIASGRSLLRFGVNSTVGLLGLFDPADAWWNLEHEEATLGGTLTHYGVGYGVYLVLPLLGPSDLRNSSSLLFEYLTHPVYYLTDRTTGGYIRMYDSFQDIAPTLKQYPVIVSDTEDPYLFVRNLYLQRVERDAVYMRYGLEGFERDRP